MRWDLESTFEIVPMLTREPGLWQHVAILEGTAESIRDRSQPQGLDPQHRKRRLKQLIVLKVMAECVQKVNNDRPC